MLNSWRNSQSPKSQSFLYFSKKVMNKFLKKHFRIIVSIFYINWIKKFYFYIKTLNAAFCDKSFFSLLIFFVICTFTISFFRYIVNIPQIAIYLSKSFSFFIIKHIHLVSSEYLLYILISGKNMHIGLISLLFL